MMNNIDILKKHINKGEEIVLKNEDGTEDRILLKPLNMMEQTIAFNLSKKFKIKNGSSPDVDKVDDADFNMMFDLMKSVLKRSIEGLDDDTAEQFVLQNIDEFQEVLPKLVAKGKSSKHADLIKQKRGEI